MELVPLRPREDLMPTREISRRAGVSRKFLDHLLLQLNKAGIVVSKMGSRGGYSLSRPPEEINMAEVLDAIRGDMLLSDCSKADENCPRLQFCQIHVWIGEMEDMVRKFAQSVSLKDLYDKVPAGNLLSFTI